jgi:peptidoglycan/xylan/chitin deacetylase (PgdA/CDA1 family)
VLANGKRRIGSAAEQGTMSANKNVRVCFADGARKALSMSYDDGSEHDRRLVALFAQCGLRATFHLTSAALGEPYRIGRDEVVRLYAGHEVACHGATHADLMPLSDDDVRRELATDKAALEAITGQPVRGLAYAFGHHDARIERLAAEAGFTYARGVTDSFDFSLPAAPYRLSTTCHHNQALEFGRHLLMDGNGPVGLQWMRVRGHSFEFDGFLSADTSKDWRYIEEFCRMMGAAEGLWHASLIEVLDYLAAARQLTRSADGTAMVNPSGRPVWLLTAAGGALALPPGAALALP